MKNYELTERGKIIIAVIMVILLVVLSFTILAIRAWAGSAPPPDDPPVTAVPLPASPDIAAPETSEPLPNGSGFNPLEPTDDPDDEPADDPVDEPADEPADEPTNQDLPESDNGESGSYDPTHDEQKFGPVSLNLSKGTMVFIFSPDLQDALDDETTAMLGEFITSPKNTAGTQITVEIPNLSEEDFIATKDAVVKAFALHGVTQKDLVFTILRTGADGIYFEIMLSFTDPINYDTLNLK